MFFTYICMARGIASMPPWPCTHRQPVRPTPLPAEHLHGGCLAVLRGFVWKQINKWHAPCPVSILPVKLSLVQITQTNQSFPNSCHQRHGVARLGLPTLCAPFSAVCCHVHRRCPRWIAGIVGSIVSPSHQLWHFMFTLWNVFCSYIRCLLMLYKW